MGAGSRPALLDSGRDSRAARGQARGCLPPRLGPRRVEGNLAAPGGARLRYQRGRGGPEGSGHLPMSVARLRLAPVGGNKFFPPAPPLQPPPPPPPAQSAPPAAGERRGKPP